jgi:hypothetical protein
MGEAFIVRKGGVVSDTTAAPTITIVSEDPTGVTFTLTNNDDNTAFITYEIDDEIGAVELAAAATSGNITVALAAGTYTLTAYATVVGEVATQSTAAVEIVVIPTFELLGTVTISTATNEVNFINLNITKDDNLQLVSTAVGDVTGDNSQGFLYVNNNTTGSNYTGQELQGEAGVISAARYTNPFFVVARSNQPGQSLVNIKISNNDRFVYQAMQLRNIGDTGNLAEHFSTNVVGNFTVSSITSINIRGSRNFTAGTKFTLYKVNTGDA